MTDHHDAQDYTANGPSAFGFRTGGANIDTGVEAFGVTTGVHGVGVGHDDLIDFFVTGVLGESSRGYGVRGIATMTNFPGVVGESDLGAGVEGRGKTGVSGYGDEGVGVSGQSKAAPGVSGKSGTGPGAEFESEEGAQLHLVPRELAKLPVAGKAGDLLVALVPTRSGDQIAQLWFCQRGSDQNTAAVWGIVDITTVQP